MRCEFFFMVVLAAATAAQCAWAQAESQSPIQTKAEPFSPANVRLLDGPFKQARDRHAEYLLGVEPDRLLARYRIDAGLEPKAEGYGGWEAEGIGGHTLGHYLSAISKMYAGTGDTRFLDRVNAIVADLADCQAANGDGYVAAIPDGRRVFAEVARGEIRTKSFDLNGVWVPWYTIHKEMAGLRDAYAYCGNQQALGVMSRLADWAMQITDELNDEQLNQMLRCEHGGMNEVAAELAAMTGDQRYLQLAERFNDHQVLDPLSRQEDILSGLHANTQIPKLVGAARQHELTGNQALGDAAEFFWDVVTHRHSYAIGGNSLNEYFGPPGVIGARLDGNTTETCNTYNMLRLTRHLYAWSGDPRYVEYYERALFNHILASQDHETGAVCYYVPLRPASQKPFQQLYSDFTCCVGTGMENHASYGELIYAHDDEGLIVNLFIASELRWPEVGLKLTQETGFPDEPSTLLTVATDTPIEGTLKIRQPAWAVGPVKIEINGQPVSTDSNPGSYVSLVRLWDAGDTVRVSLDMPLRIEPTPDDPGRVAVMAGPIVLAGVLGAERPSPDAVPCLVSQGSDLLEGLDRAGSELLKYHTNGIAQPRDVPLVPFFRVEHEFYNVYWSLLSPEQWQEQLAQFQAQEAMRQALEARTTDFVQPGEMQPERDHAFEGDRTNHGEHGGLRWRDAYRGGWFSFRMSVSDTRACSLVCTYWGDDYGDRSFDILIDDQVIATQTLNRNRAGEFFDVEYAIPLDLTRGKHDVRVKFQAHQGKTAGGVFGCRIVHSE